MTERRTDDAVVLPLCLARQAGPDHQIRVLALEHRQLRALCDRLEYLADGLPALPPDAEREEIARALTGLLPQHHAQEVVLLERLFATGPRAAMGRVLMHRICGQHLADEAHAQDLAGTLEAAGPLLAPAQAETLGYMLRCFFDSCRRALAFEELAIFTVLGRRLSPATAALLLGGG